MAVRHSTKALIRQAGATLVEVLVAIALTGIMLPALTTALVSAHAGRASAAEKLQATSLLREAEDALQSIRAADWSNVATDGTYHPVISGSAWALASGSETINGYSRQIVISSVERNSSGAIVASGGTLDPSTKQVTISVAWSKPAYGSIGSTAYLTRWQNGAVWTQTSQADFAGGSFNATCGSALCNSAFAADTVGLADTPPTWQLPSIVGSYNLTGNVDATAVYVSGSYAYVGFDTGMAILNISNPKAPALVGTYTTTAAVNGITVSGNTAYLATAMTTAQLVLVDVSNPAAPSTIGSLAVGDTAAANAVAVSGNYAYVVKDSATLTTNGEFNVVDISNPAAPLLVGKLRVAANMNGVAVSGNYAYVANAKSKKQLLVVDISNPAAPVSAATENLGAAGNAITLSGNTAYVVTAKNSTTGEFQLWDISTPTAPSVIGNYAVGAAVVGVFVSGDYAQLATATANEQLIDVNIATPNAPSLITDVNIGSKVDSIFSVGPYAYVGDIANNKEFQVVYAGYQPSGSFESGTFDAGSSVGYTYLNFSASVPGGASLKLQVAANDTGSGWSYVGPDGTSGSYFTSPGAIPLSAASGRYFRYKAYFTPTSNGQQTPTLNDVEVSYTP